MKPDITEVYAGPDPVFRNTFVCFQLAVAEAARIFGHWLDGLMEDLEVERDARTILRAAALDVRHLERFVGAARLDLPAVRRQLLGFAGLIGRALGEEILAQDRTPAFRETFLALLPAEPRRAARSLGVVLQSRVAEAEAERRQKEARLGVAAELGFLAWHLGELATDAEAFAHLPAEDQRLARFAGRMAESLAILARTVGGKRERRSPAEVSLATAERKKHAGEESPLYVE
jgi:hypothetical protein